MDWQGKTAVFLGDSITEGTGVEQIENTYLYVVQRKLGLQNAFNHGIGGTCIARVPGRSGAFVDRYAAMERDAQLVCVFGGTNDYGVGGAFGQEGDVTADTFCGALEVLYSGLKRQYPHACIVILTPVKREKGEQLSAGGMPLSAYVQAIRHAAKRHGLLILNAYDQVGIAPDDPENKAAYCPDGLHPNSAGQRLIADALIDFLQSEDLS